MISHQSCLRNSRSDSASGSVTVVDLSVESVCGAVSKLFSERGAL
jgi:hypothetical protein